MINNQETAEIFFYASDYDFPYRNMCAALSTVFLSTGTDLNAVQNRGKDRILPLKVTVLLVSILLTVSTTGGKILDETYRS